MNRIVFPVVVLLAAAQTTTPARAHDHATGVVKERMDGMKQMANRLKSLRKLVDGKANPAAAKADAAAIAGLASHMLHLFPPGSTQRPTDARDSIWTNWPDFEAKARQLEAASQNVANAGGDSVTAFAAKVRALSQACSACHQDYRIKR